MTKQKDENKKEKATSSNKNNQKNKAPNLFNQLSGSKPGDKPKFNIYWIYGVIALAIFLFQYLYAEQQTKETDWRTFKNEMLFNGDVEKVNIVNGKIAEIYLKDDKLSSGRYDELIKDGTTATNKKGPHYYISVVSPESFEKKIELAQKERNISEDDWIYVGSEERKDYFADIFSWLFPIIILVAIWLFFMRRMSGGAGGPGGIFNVGKSKAQLFDKERTVKIDFSHVAGLEEAKTEIREIVDFLKSPDKYTKLGAKIPKGALLIGPPGTGKTLLAKAVAGEAHVPFFSLSGSDFVEMFVGVGASRVRDLFKQAKEKAPCIIFIDEIDAIGRARGRNPNMGSNDERENTLNQLLTEMDGFGSNIGVIILAATNRADMLDRALMRAGRFDRQIHVELPDIKERKEIFEVHLKPIKYDKKNIKPNFFAKQTPGFSGADIANVCNEAALIAARKNKKIVGKQDFLDAIDRIIGGLEKKNKIMTLDEKKTIAYHEAGHATVSWLLEHANPLVKVTIVPRGKALGAAWYLPEERQITTYEQILDEMCSLLGGRASELVNFGKISTGALNDLEKVTKQANAIVSYYGMSEKIGNISFYDSSGQSEYSFHKPFSEKTAEIIDSEVNLLVEKQYQRAIDILKTNKEGLEKLAKRLVEKEVLFTEDLEEIFGKRQFGKTRMEEIEELNDKKKTTIKAEKNVAEKETELKDKEIIE